MTNLLILYRYFSDKKNDIKLKYLNSFVKQYKKYIKLTNPNIKTKFCLICDNTEEPQQEECKEILKKIKHKFISIKSKELIEKEKNPFDVQHYTLFRTSMELIKKYADDDTVIFFCENDYLYKPSAIDYAVKFLTNHPLDFLSLSDHPNRYATPHIEEENHSEIYKNYKLELIWEQKHHWRTSISTCYTFITTLRAIKQYDDLFLGTDKQYFDHWFFVDIYRRGHSKLWTPVPGMASHMQGMRLNDWDWSKLMKKEEKEIINDKETLFQKIEKHAKESLAKIMGKYHSDKNHPCHNYVRWYDIYFSPLRENDLSLLELGYFYGHSHNGWDDFFPKGKIYSVENSPDMIKESKKFNHTVFEGDCEDIVFLEKVMKEIKELDIIIDDAGHKSKQQIESFKYLFPLLNKGGIYIIEDLQTSYWPGFVDPIQGSTINFIKKRVDDLHYHGQQGCYSDYYMISDEIKAKYFNDYEKSIESIHMYPGICFIFKRMHE